MAKTTSETPKKKQETKYPMMELKFVITCKVPYNNFFGDEVPLDWESIADRGALALEQVVEYGGPESIMNTLSEWECTDFSDPENTWELEVNELPQQETKE